MNECHDCVFYERPGHSPPECTCRERDRILPEDGEACRYKLTLADAKYQNEEGL